MYPGVMELSLANVRYFGIAGVYTETHTTGKYGFRGNLGNPNGFRVLLKLVSLQDCVGFYLFKVI
jgi:hypothetical protein